MIGSHTSSHNSTAKGLNWMAVCALVATAGCASTQDRHDESHGHDHKAHGAHDHGDEATTSSAADPDDFDREFFAAPHGDVSELGIEDLEVGAGPEAQAGQEIAAHYTGWLTDGTLFDSSRGRGSPLRFQLGAGRVIQGWDQGIVGMKVGGRRRLTIPAALAYGDRGVGPIPPNSTLVFVVELVEAGGS